MNLCFRLGIDEWLDTIQSEEIYLVFPFLLKYKEYFWNFLSRNDIVWLWRNWLVINSKKYWTVIKIGIDDIEEKNIYDEQLNQERFYHKLQELKKLSLIPNYIKIPLIMEPVSWWIFMMEKINWISLKKILFMDVYNDILKNYDDIINKTDFEISKILISKWITKRDQDLLIEQTRKDPIKFVNKYIDISKAEWFKITLEQLKNHWYSHLDLNAWNIIIWDDWNIYIIDFWVVSIKDRL